MSQQNPEQQKRQREELQDHSVSSQQAAQQAERLVEEQKTPEFLEEFRDTDFPEWVEEELGPETSQVWAIANETRSDHRRHRWLNENRSERVISEHEPGRLCRGPLLELAQGVNDRPDIGVATDQTDRERRHVREAEEAKTALQSLGVEGRGLSAVTEAIHTTRTESKEEGEESGRVRGALNKVFR